MSTALNAGSMYQMELWYSTISTYVEEGLLDPEEVAQALRDVAYGRYHAMRSWCMPPWWRAYALQIERVRQVWGGITLPNPPEVFVSRTATEVPVLYVPDDPEFIWSHVETRESDKRCVIDFDQLIVDPYKEVFNEPAWLAIDVGHGRGKPVSKFQGRSDLAGIEVFSMMLQFPGWFEHWHVKGAAAPILGGYRLPDRRGELTNTISLSQWHGADKNVRLSQERTTFYSPNWAVPTVRLLEC